MLGGGTWRQLITASLMIATAIVATPPTAHAAATCAGKAVTVDLNIAGQAPTSGDDVIQGTSGDDVINSGAGNDTVCGLGGNDTINGQAGNDVIEGGAGNDELYGSWGNDTVNGGAGNDTLKGNDGTDTMNGQSGDDVLEGGAGNDQLYGSWGNDTVNGGAGNDTLKGNDGIDVMNGQAGRDVLEGGTGNDTLYGSGGNDTIDGGEQRDTIFGGWGDDTINGGAGNDTIRGEGGHDLLNGQSGADTVYGGDGNDKLWGAGAPDKLYGGIGNDIIKGGWGDDTIKGDAGADTLDGEGGHDFLLGGAGNDKLTGSAGNDNVNGEAGTDDCSAETERRCLTDNGVRRVTLVVEALEAYAAEHGTFSLPGGSNNTGRGWLGLTNGTSYTKSIADVLMDGGYLEPNGWKLDPFEIVIYHCNGRAGVFAETDASPSASSSAQWQGCTKAGINAGLTYYETTAKPSTGLPDVAVHPKSIKARSVVLQWEWNEDPSIEALGVFVDNNVVEWLHPSNLAYTISGLKPNTEYEVGVYPVKPDYNPGPLDNNIPIVTTVGNKPPVQPVLGIWDMSDTSITVRWGYSDAGTVLEPDDSGPVEYRLLLNGEVLDVTPSSDARAHTFDGLWPNTLYEIQLMAIDQDGNVAYSPKKSATTRPPTLVPNPAPPADTIAPIWGSGLVPPQITVDVHRPTSVDLTWCCALDYDQFNIVPARFDLYARRSGTSGWEHVADIVATNTGGSYTLARLGGSPLVTGANYSVRVVAVDAAGNRSKALQRHNVQPRAVAPPSIVDGSIAPDPEPGKNPSPPGPGSTGEPIPAIPVPELIPPSDVVVVPSGDNAWECGTARFTRVADTTSAAITWRDGPDGAISYRGTLRDLAGEPLAVAATSADARSLHFDGLRAGRIYSVTIEAWGLAQVDLGRCQVRVVAAFGSDTPPPSVQPPPLPADAESIAVCLTTGMAVIIGGRIGSCYIYADGVLYASSRRSLTAGLDIACGLKPLNVWNLIQRNPLNIFSFCGNRHEGAVVTANTNNIADWGYETQCHSLHVDVVVAGVDGSGTCTPIDSPSGLRFRSKTAYSTGTVSLSSVLVPVSWEHSRSRPQGTELRIAHLAFCQLAPAGSYPSSWCHDPAPPAASMNVTWSCSNPHIYIDVVLSQNEPVEFVVEAFRDLAYNEGQIYELRVRPRDSPYRIRVDRPWNVDDYDPTVITSGGVARIVLRGRDVYDNEHVVDTLIVPWVPECAGV